MAFEETQAFSLRRPGHGIWGDPAMAFGETPHGIWGDAPWHLRRPGHGI